MPRRLASPSPDPPLSPALRRVFRVVMGLLPVLFFLVLEGGLRLFGYGDAYPLFVPLERRPDQLYMNRDVARRYFTRLETLPTGLFDFFPAQKAPDTYRIMVQGGSSAAGFPFYYGAAFSRILEERLARTFPERRIEVVNTAMAAVNSYTLLDFADEILAQQPDAVLIYAGHNEYYGALGVGSAETFGGSAALTRLYVRLQGWRTVQLVRNLLAGTAGVLAGTERGAAPSATVMERMVGEQRIPYGSALYTAGLEQFRGNLARLLTRYQRAGVPVFIGTLASNERDHAPFLTVLADGTDAVARQAALREVETLLAGGDTTAALAGADALIRMDSLGADAFYLRGRLLDGLGRRDEARMAYRAAKDRDALRFRAPEAMNRIIREEAARHGAVVVDVQAALAAASPGGLIGKAVITEHLHPNPEGYFWMADAFYEALHAAGAVGAWERPVPPAQARRDVLLTPVDSLVGRFRLRRLMGSWPFQPAGVVDRSLDTLTARDSVEAIALDLYRGRLGWGEANAALRRYYETATPPRYADALRTARAAVQEYPFLPEPYLEAGNALMGLQRYDDALRYFEASNARGESGPAQRMIGTIKLQQGDREGAIPPLERAVALQPNNEQALYNLSGAYALTGRYDDARATVGRLLEIAPGHAAGRRLLASLPLPDG